MAALFCLVCAFWNGWRWRLWRQLYDESRLLGRWWLADLPSVLFAAAFAVLLCVMGAWRIFGEGWPIFDGRLS
ncbi:MAG: hypothetical protein Q4D82_04870 [Neisseria sp.]|nr:hypothetical protein [Neisseria sp.]